MAQTVAILGRTNVGKSTLFNRLLSDRLAIVSKQAGTTRDRHYAKCYWRGCDFILADTGGWIEKPQTEIDQAINKQSLQAATTADVVLLVVDGQSGIISTDRHLLRALQKINTPIILVANKIDNNRWRQQLSEFYQLGLSEPLPVSAANGVGTGDLLDVIVDHLEKNKKRKKKKAKIINQQIKVTIIGKPNVGKSSLINSLLNEERLIVSATPHTTRDAQDIELKYQDKMIVFTDTAGWRRKYKQGSLDFEKESIGQGQHRLRQTDVALVVTDVSQSLTWQDKEILETALSAGKGVIILANKWDLIPDKKTNSDREYLDYYYSFFPFATFVPVIFCSALNKVRLKQILENICTVFAERQREISDNALDKILKDAIKRHRPSRGKGTSHPFIYSLEQVDSAPPTFKIRVKPKTSLHQSYLRFIENNLRYKFGFQGVPIRIYIEKTLPQK